jgi:hypothetical protein
VLVDDAVEPERSETLAAREFRKQLGGLSARFVSSNLHRWPP